MSSLRYVAALFLQAALVGSVYAAENGDPPHSLPQSLFPGVTYASIATETEKLTSEAPAVISVITAEDLHNHGVTSLEQALEEIPGVYSPFRFLNGNFVFRGVRSQFITNPEVILMVDNIPQNDAFDGVLQRYITRIPIGNIERIEVIRGAGSSLYGADAFAGVINIITKTDENYHSDELRVRGGSSDTQEADAVLKGKIGNMNALLSMQVKKTDGHQPLITEDAQTYFDNQFGTNVSLAHGQANTNFEEGNIYLELFSKKWRTRLQLRDHTLGMGLSFFNALTNSGEGRSTQKNIDVFYINPDWLRDWLFKARFNYLEDKNKGTKPLLPEGAFDGDFPEGVLQELGGTEKHIRIEGRLLTEKFDKHEVIIGAGLIYIEYVDLIYKSNFEFLPDGTLLPIGQFSDQSPDQKFMGEKTRIIKYLLVQDNWNVARDFIFNAGARIDEYSDIDTVINPRIALIWLTRHDLTAKLIANRAFRSPTFLELYSKAAFQVGNPDLEPSNIQSLELVIEKTFFDSAVLNLSISQFKIKDMIVTIHDVNGRVVSINSDDEITGNGLEIETRIPINANTQIKSSYSYQRNEQNGITIYNAAPHHKIYAGIDWYFKRNWNLYTNVLWVNDFTRDINDPRDDLGSSTFVGAVLRYTSPTKRWDAYLSIRNIFDEEAVAPSDDYRFLPNDYPLPGRNFMAEIRYRM